MNSEEKGFSNKLDSKYKGNSIKTNNYGFRYHFSDVCIQTVNVFIKVIYQSTSRILQAT